MKARNLKLHNRLRSKVELDLLYFLPEDYLDTYLEAVELQSASPILSNNIFNV